MRSRDGDYHYAGPVPAQATDVQAAGGDDPWIVVAAALEAAKRGDGSGIAHLRRWVVDKQAAPTLVAACLDLIADPGRRDDLEFLAGLMLDGSDGLRIEACQVAQWWGAWWLVPYMLEARKAVRRLPDKQTIEANVSNLMESVDGEPVLYDGQYDDAEYAELVHARTGELASQAGTDEVAVFGGELLDMDRVIRRMRQALVNRSRSGWTNWGAFLSWRRKFEPFTGVDCSGFYSATGEFMPLNAAAVLERYAEDHPHLGFVPGQRFFFGQRVEPAGAVGNGWVVPGCGAGSSGFHALRPGQALRFAGRTKVTRPARGSATYSASATDGVLLSDRLDSGQGPRSSSPRPIGDMLACLPDEIGFLVSPSRH